MALKPTIYKADFNLVDMDNNCFETLKLTLAQHPSETLERMMVRLLVFGLNYHPDLAFTKGLSTQDEPDLWQISPDGRIERWIELGQASPERIRKGVSRAEQIALYAYGSEADVWWPKHQLAFAELPKLNVFRFDHNQVKQLRAFVNRTMELTLTITDGELYLTGEGQELTLQVETLLVRD
ncbi:MAG: YaeQ family protein [Marinobacterium sp.]|nr:YaeQ family protein [Marinobacterium sp.]